MRSSTGFLVALLVAATGHAHATPRELATNAAGSMDPPHHAVVGNVLVYAGGPATDVEPWRSDGTVSGTTLLKEIGTTAASPPRYFSAGPGVVYFLGPGSLELWKSQGTAASTELVRRFDDIISSLTATGDRAYFTVSGASGTAVWTSDGTDAGTVQLKSGLPPGGGDLPRGFVALGSQVLFAADDGITGLELWRTDGTPAGTTLLKDLKPGPLTSGIAGLTVANGLAFFTASSDSSPQLWRSDGTASGTFAITEGVSVQPGYDPGLLRAVGNSVFFLARDAAGMEVWRSDGAPSGTHRVTDICPGPCDASASGIVGIGAIAYFTARSETDGWEVWRSDGTPGGTYQLKDIRPGVDGPPPQWLTPVGQYLYFAADDGAHGQELWVSDGTPAGTRLAFDLAPGSASTSFEWLAAAPHGLFFATAAPGVYDKHLWFEEVAQPVVEQGRLVNLASRARIMTGDDVAIAGFTIVGTSNKTVLVRARGPSLASQGVASVLDNPTMQLFRSPDGASVASNDDWGTASNALAVEWSGYKPSDPRESAVLVSLAPGAYTAVVSGVAGAQGVGIVEVFEVAQPEVRLTNISTRARIQAGDDVLIGGLVIQGDHPRTVVLRARGPSLADFGISGTLANPHLRLIRADGTVAADNDDWQQASNAAAIQASGFAPSNAAEAAILVTLPPGAYTVVMSGVADTSGVGIVEVFGVQ